MSENLIITSQQAIAPQGPVMGVKKWSDLYGVPATTQTVTSSAVQNPAGNSSPTEQINIPLGN